VTLTMDRGTGPAGTLAGAIDCDVHPVAPRTADLLPHLDAHWADTARHRDVVMRELTSYPPNAPTVRRPDWGVAGEAGGDLESLRRDLLDRWGLAAAILTPLFGGAMMHDALLGEALCRAHNDWIREAWLDAEPRLRASIVVNPIRPERAAAEIDRAAADRRFVQVILPVHMEIPVGRPVHRPIFEACTRHGLPLALHAGSMFRNPTSQAGYFATFSEDYAGQVAGFTAQVANLISEGVFAEYPELTVVLLESGVTWLAPFMWRFSKDWRGVRNEVPWVDRPPADIIRDRVRLTAQPFDAPAEAVEKVLAQIGSEEMILFASDYPHWHYDGDDAIPAGWPEAGRARLLRDNARATYPRLKED
jgi:hypothetical protein